ncbi:uncharacterized protein ACR2FA_007795 [Aphomia sociella]
MENVKLKASAFAIQCWGTFCISFLACQTGYVFAWPSYNSDFFKSNETILSYPMSTWQISLLGSLPNIGSLIATPFCGYAFNVLGRKYATILFGLPYVLAWTIISFTTNVILILIAMTIAGIGIAGQNVSLIFISEISHDSIRGGATASSASGYFLGLLISYAIGGYLTYYQVIYTHLTLSVVGMLLLMFLKESPIHLTRIGKEKEAAKSIAFYNRVDVNSKEVEMELRKIRLQLDPRLEKMLDEQQDPEVTGGLLNEKLGNDLNMNNESPWKILKSSTCSKRALETVLIVIILSVMMGCVALQVYAESLFKEAIPSLPSNLCSIFLAVVFLAASFVCVVVVDKFGRKNLFIFTSLISGVFTLLLASQLQFHWAPHWCTALFIYSFSFIYSLGSGIIPFVLIAEVFLPEVRDLCSSISLSITWIANFVTLLIFNPLVQQLGLGQVFYIFSAICFIGALYGQLRLPETKGKSVDAIQVFNENRRPMFLTINNTKNLIFNFSNPNITTMSSETVKLSAFVVQGSSTLAISFLTSLTGFVYGWPSFTLANFMSNDTVLSAPMSQTEVSLLGSLTNIGALVATPFCGYILNAIGRKHAAMLFGLPFVIAWAVVSLTTSVPLVLAAVGFSGVGAAGQAVSAVYISEICQDSIRGALTSTTASGYFVGLLLSYILGGYLTYHQVVYAYLSLSILYVLILSLLKESPVYLIQKGKIEEAARSIAFYRRVDKSSKEVELEIRKIKLQLDPRLEKLLQANDIQTIESLIDSNGKNEEVKLESEWKFLCKSSSSKRALMSCLVIMSVTILMGAIVLQVYAEPLFKEALPSMEPNLCSIFLASDFIVASLLCALMLDRVGRKILLTSSSVASGVCALFLGTQLWFHWAPVWCTVVVIYLYCFVYNLGVAVVPFVLTAEVFLPEVRGLCNSLVLAAMWIMNFITLIIFNPLVTCLGLGPIFCGFSVICFLGAIYSHFCLPETKGLSADAIQLLFLNSKSR